MVNIFRKREQKDTAENQNKSGDESGKETEAENPVHFLFGPDDGSGTKMSFIDHLDELRKRLLVVLIVLLLPLLLIILFIVRFCIFLHQHF